ncbi:MAG: hypothetical protein R2911_13615 [Caldilineaceae bacterium]
MLLTALDAPADLRQGESFDLSVTMQASAQTDATLRIYGDGNLIHAAAVRLQPGDNRVQIPVADLPVGFHRFPRSNYARCRHAAAKQRSRRLYRGARAA